jgi:ABC-type transport system involved in cytochrome bd biosynthesis fused ATPase/permease subunit
LNEILRKADEYSRHIDTQANIIIGISSALFLFSGTQIEKGENEYFLFTLAVFSALSAFTGLMAIHPPEFMRKRGQKESLFYNRKVASFRSAEDYSPEMEKILETEESITREMTTEIYNLYKYYYRPKRNLFNVARNIFITGVFLSLVVFIFSRII